jgi:hypothetical protein
MNQKDKNLGKSIFVYFDMTFLTTLTGIFDFANSIFQTWILQAKNPVQTWKKNPAGYFKLENWKNQVQINRVSRLYQSDIF